MKKKMILAVILVLVGFVFVACNDDVTDPVPSATQSPTETSPPRDTIGVEDARTSDNAVIASISGNWDLAFRNSRITLSEDFRFETSWDNMVIINGQFSISAENETDYRISMMPDRVRTLSANQPEFGAPQFDDEYYTANSDWMQRDIIVNPANRSALGLVNNDGTIEWVDIYFSAEVLWLEDRIGETSPPELPPASTEVPLHTVEELGGIIEAAGDFWNSWWASHHTFEWAHIDDSRRNWQPWYEEITPAHHPLSRGFAIILPSSGFETLSGISNYLLQFYSQDWKGRGEIAEPRTIMQTPDGEEHYLFGANAFEEYDGELFVFIQTEWSARPNWQAASHTIVEQEGNRAVVETIVPMYIHNFRPYLYGDEVPTFTYNFIFIDGKIDAARGQWNG